jgi:hypothetical protein
MKRILTAVVCLTFVTASIHAASDADVTIVKAKKVVTEEDTITIVAAAKTTITLIRGAHDPAFTGDTWHGMPVTRVQVVCNNGTFTIKRPRPYSSLPEAWQMSLKAAKNLQDGKEVGRIGYYAPDIVIKGNMIDSVTGEGFLHPKRE